MTGTLRASIQAGRAGAQLARAHRMLEADLDRYGSGFGVNPTVPDRSARPRSFDGTMLSLIVQVTAYAAPWLRPETAHIVNRTSLWLFGIDRLTDHQAKTEADVDDAIARTLAVIDGQPAPPGDGLFELLAAIRAGLADQPTYSGLAAAWRAEAYDVLLGMRREVTWRRGPAPSVEEYLANAQSTGMRFLFLTLLIADGATPDDWSAGPGTIREAADAMIRVMRLVNDIGGHAREAAFGDVDVFSLGLARSEVDAEVRRSLDRCVLLLSRQPARRRRWASYLECVMGFSAGLYGAAGDYWGTE